MANRQEHRFGPFNALAAHRDESPEGVVRRWLSLSTSEGTIEITIGLPHETVILEEILAMAGRLGEITCLANAALSALDDAKHELPAVEAVRELAERARRLSSALKEQWMPPGEVVAGLQIENRRLLDRLAKLDALLASEEPPAELTRELAHALVPGGDLLGLRASRKAWHWFREALGVKPVRATP